jgi:integrative and conjugative element protein (TIGR02256 family)
MMGGRTRPHKSSCRLLIHLSVLEFIEAEATKATKTETGGVLAGHGDIIEGEIHLTHASEAGPKARKTLFSFARDTSYCQQFLDRLAVESVGRIDYLGEWHKHHEAEPRPSPRDIKTSTNIALNPDYHVSHCLLLIIGKSNHRSSLRAFVVCPSGATSSIGWNICTGCEAVIGDDIP